VSYACQEINLSSGKISFKCKNLKFFHFEEVKVHLYKKRFIPGYWYWACHGESESMVYDVVGVEYEMDHD